MSGDNRALVVVAKHPEVGRVKTRLAKSVGAVAACELYRAFLRDIVSRFDGGDYAFFIAYTPPDAPFDAYGAASFAQVGETLNDRLRAIFERQRGRYRATLVLSSDSPHVSAAWIDAGFALLEREDIDIVLGPALDGGYWCIAMREAHDVFTGVPMSTPLVLQRTLTIARAKGLRCQVLPATFDVDEIADVDLLSIEIARTALSLPATGAALAHYFERNPHGKHRADRPRSGATADAPVFRGW